MTLIAAVVDNEKTVHMMGDRLTGNSAGDVMIRAFPKIAMLTPANGQDKLLIGTAGNQELDTVCTGLFTPPPLPEDKNDLALYRWSMNEMRVNLRETLTEHDLFSKDKESGEQVIPGTILIAARGMIMKVITKVIPIATQRPYWAIGNGDDIALGVLHYALGKDEKRPSARQCKEYLLAGLRAAVTLKDSVAPPFDYINTKGEQELIER